MALERHHAHNMDHTQGFCFEEQLRKVMQHMQVQLRRTLSYKVAAHADREPQQQTVSTAQMFLARITRARLIHSRICLGSLLPFGALFGILGDP